MVSCDTRFSSSTPAPARRFASSTISPSGLRERCLPRICGMTQNEHFRLQLLGELQVGAGSPGAHAARIARGHDPVRRVSGRASRSRFAPRAPSRASVCRFEPRKWIDHLGHVLFEIGPRTAGSDSRVTTSLRHSPVFLCSDSSRIVSIDSFFAASMKPQVLTTMTSASPASSTCRYLLHARRRRASPRYRRGSWGSPTKRNGSCSRSCEEPGSSARDAPCGRGA